MSVEYTKLMDELAETYKRMKSYQRSVVFHTKTEKEAIRKRKEALAYVMERLYKMLKDRGDPRISC